MTATRWRRVVIAPKWLRLMREAAETAYPTECCGLLIGGPYKSTKNTLHVTRVAASVNLLAAEISDGFEVDSELRFRLMRELRGGPERIVGHYHSHPDGPATPSARDALMAYERDLAWLIISVSAGRALDAAFFLPLPSGGDFEHLPLLETDTDSKTFYGT